MNQHGEAGHGYTDIGAVICDGELSTDPGECGTYSYELAPGRHILIETEPGGHWSLRVKPAGKPMLTQKMRTDAVSAITYRKVLPGILSLASNVTFADQEELTPAREFGRRLQVIQHHIRYWQAPFRPGASADELAALTPEQVILIGFAQSFKGETIQDAARRADSLARLMRTEYLLPGSLGLRVTRELAPGLLRDIPEQYAPLLRILGPAEISPNLDKAGLLMDMIGFSGIASQSRSAGTLTEYRDRLTLPERAGRVQRRGVPNAAYWQDREWWAHIPDHMLPVVMRFTCDQARALIYRAHTCRTDAARALLINEIAAGSLGTQITFMDDCSADGFTGDKPAPWCAEAGLSDFVHRIVTAALGSGPAHELFAAASQEGKASGNIPAAAAWVNLIRDYDELKGMPVSWWAALGEGH